jgi:hypothetical protein
LVARLDSSNAADEGAAWSELKPIGAAVVPYLVAAFTEATRWQERVSLAFRTVEDARAAIDAIARKNHHYFVDRTHSGRSFWVVNPEDERT